MWSFTIANTGLRALIEMWTHSLNALLRHVTEWEIEETKCKYFQMKTRSVCFQSDQAPVAKSLMWKRWEREGNMGDVDSSDKTALSLICSFLGLSFRWLQIFLSYLFYFLQVIVNIISCLRLVQILFVLFDHFLHKIFKFLPVPEDFPKGSW